MKIEADAKTMTSFVAAMGAVVQAMIATLPPAQQKVFLLKLMENAESAESKNDMLLMQLINALMQAGQMHQRPE